FNVTFTPTAVGSRTGTLSVTTSAASTPQAVNLSGTGTAPQVSFSAPSLSFGNQLITTTSAAQTETVTNTGTSNLTVASVTIGGANGSDFALSSDTCT